MGEESRNASDDLDTAVESAGDFVLSGRLAITSTQKKRAMRIINQAVLANLRNNRPLNLNLGSGGQPPGGDYAVDLLALPGVDIQADLNQALDLIPKDSVSNVTSLDFEYLRSNCGRKEA
jgi:hypothetical protein